MNVLKDIIQIYKVLYLCFGWLFIAISPIGLMLLFSEWFALLFLISLPLGIVIFDRSTKKMLSK